MKDILILIVEDEDAIRLTLRDYLQKKGFRVVVASDGVGAIKQLLDNNIDIIVSDYRMDIFGGDYWIKFLKIYCPEQKVFITSDQIVSLHHHKSVLACCILLLMVSSQIIMT